MVNNIDAISGYHYSPYMGVQAREQAQVLENTPQTEEIKSKALGPKECKTCKNRTYKDRSNDPSVSFQTPTHVSPEMAVTAVRAHEQEHVSHNAEYAERKGQKAHSTVSIHTAACPECGRIYVSGGTTTTTYTADQTPQEINPEQNKGNFINTFA